MDVLFQNSGWQNREFARTTFNPAHAEEIGNRSFEAAKIGVFAFTGKAAPVANGDLDDFRALK